MHTYHQVMNYQYWMVCTFSEIVKFFIGVIMIIVFCCCCCFVMKLTFIPFFSETHENEIGKPVFPFICYQYHIERITIENYFTPLYILSNMFNFIHIFTEMLRANLALKIKSSKFDENLENLSSKDFNNIALTYCQQVGIHWHPLL